MSPSLAGASAVPHSGQWVGMTNGTSSPVALLDHRSDDLRDHVTGPAHDHRVADEHAAADHVLALCSVAFSTVTPPT